MRYTRLCQGSKCLRIRIAFCLRCCTYSVTVISRPHDSQWMSPGASALTVRLVFSGVFEMTKSHLYHLAQIHQVSLPRGDSLRVKIDVIQPGSTYPADTRSAAAEVLSTLTSSCPRPCVQATAEAKGAGSTCSVHVITPPPSPPLEGRQLPGCGSTEWLSSVLQWHLRSKEEVQAGSAASRASCRTERHTGAPSRAGAPLLHRPARPSCGQWPPALRPWCPYFVLCSM